MARKYRTTIFALIGLVSALLAWFFYPREVHMRPVSFSELPGWQQADAKQSLLAFRESCKAFMKQAPNKKVGSEHIPMQAKDWQPACRMAMLVRPITEKSARDFFKVWFTPIEFYQRKPVEGLYTGYFLPLLHGSLVKTAKYNIPIYAVPKNLVKVNLELFDPKLKKRTVIGRLQGNRVLPFYKREEINSGKLARHSDVIVWVDNRVDRFFLEIQGSGIAELPNKKRLYLGYAGKNGSAYTAIGRVLLKMGVLTRETMSMQSIQKYLREHPEQIDKILNQNESFVFFRKLPRDAVYGTQGVALTPGYSLAVDRKWIPLGAPLWLQTTMPKVKSDETLPLQRLMVAQDTGGAIRGAVRGDVFWGAGEDAAFIAGHMKNQGYYWLLLPNQIVKTLKS